eukprot:Nitzschia sp. Nitz4//scaffold32_size149145//34493//35440//NITZ4_002870-RA/size149145-processed-gene-0.44-mRNA-1//1//CDS//3329548042//1924//frame0
MLPPPSSSCDGIHSRSKQRWVVIIAVTIFSLLVVVLTVAITVALKKSNKQHDSSPPISPDSTSIPHSNASNFTVYGSYEILQTVPHDSRAFTQGLELIPSNASQYWESTGLYGRSSVRRVDLATGTVLQQHDLGNDFFGEGLTHFQGKLLQVTWREQTAFIYNASTLEVLLETTYTTSTSQGWGVCYLPEDDVFYITDASAFLHVWDTSTLELLGKITVQWQFEGDEAPTSVTSLNELEWDYHHQNILANVWLQDYIVRVDPTTGFITHQYDLSALERPSNADVLNGIALTDTPNEIWVTGKLWPAMYLIRLVDY